jgi:predicted Zn-dependent protease
VPGNLQLLAGSNTLDQLIEQVENGLLVTRFHYINGFLDPRVALMTGMTRDGLFVIKNGKIKGGAKNLRFTDSMLDVFSNVLGMTSERKAVASWWGGVANMFVPAVRFGKFKFTGKTDF